jgi:hypothetical protein
MFFGHCANPDNLFWVTMLWGYLIYIIITFLFSFVSKLPVKDADPW